jgi:hypothetical protein
VVLVEGVLVEVELLLAVLPDRRSIQGTATCLPPEVLVLDEEPTLLPPTALLPPKLLLPWEPLDEVPSELSEELLLGMALEVPLEELVLGVALEVPLEELALGVALEIPLEELLLGVALEIPLEELVLGVALEVPLEELLPPGVVALPVLPLPSDELTEMTAKSMRPDPGLTMISLIVPISLPELLVT